MKMTNLAAKTRKKIGQSLNCSTNKKHTISVEQTNHNHLKTRTRNRKMNQKTFKPKIQKQKQPKAIQLKAKTFQPTFGLICMKTRNQTGQSTIDCI